jgi:hypothetical protein
MVWQYLAFVAVMVTSPKPFPVQFLQSFSGREVKICLDGRFVETTFAGKMGFRDASHQWTSVCADVRGPVHPGQYFGVRAIRSQDFGGKVAKAGNIVARFFFEAQTPDQCAGLQVAAWKAPEDGSDQLDFSSGRLQVSAGYAVLNWAQYYYQALNTPGDAVYLQTGNGGGQGGPYDRPPGGGQGGGGGGQSQLSPPVT